MSLGRDYDWHSKFKHVDFGGQKPSFFKISTQRVLKGFIGACVLLDLFMGMFNENC